MRQRRIRVGKLSSCRLVCHPPVSDLLGESDRKAPYLLAKCSQRIELLSGNVSQNSIKPFQQTGT